MSFRLRLLLLVASLFVCFVVVLGLSRRSEKAQLEFLVQQIRFEGQKHLSRWLEIIERPLHELTSDETVSLAAAGQLAGSASADDAAANWNELREDYGVDASWLVGSNGKLVAAAHSASKGNPPVLPGVDDLISAEQAGAAVTFFTETEGALWHLVARPAVGANGARAGWIVAGRKWDQAFIEKLALLSETEVALQRDHSSPLTMQPGKLTWERDLHDISGKRFRVLALARDTAPVSKLLRETGTTLGLFVGFGVLLLAALVVAMQLWVIRPMARISESLATGDVSAIEPVLKRGDEFSALARLVESSFQAKRTLEREIEERGRVENELRASRESLRNSLQLRARLARDLHDTVIQSIYAAGLGLEAVRIQLSEDPFGAEGRMRHCMASLNETIRQVRSYINDLEPHAPAEQQEFSDALRALALTMQELWPISLTLSLDDTIAHRLSRLVEINVLQIVRECISNALRHGSATHVTIELSPNGGTMGVLKVSDNGSGFDPIKRAGTGRGLVNLAMRAREMGGTLRIESEEGRGATIIVHLPLESSPA